MFLFIALLVCLVNINYEFSIVVLIKSNKHNRKFSFVWSAKIHKNYVMNNKYEKFVYNYLKRGMDSLVVLINLHNAFSVT